MSIENLPLEVLEKVLLDINSADRLNLGLCSPLLSHAVARTDLISIKPGASELNNVIFEKVEV